MSDYEDNECPYDKDGGDACWNCMYYHDPCFPTWEGWFDEEGEEE